MQDDKNITGLRPAEREVEAALTTLQPAGSRLSRDRVLFAAGQAAARRQVWRWRSAAAVLLAISCASLIVRSSPRTIERERMVYVFPPKAEVPVHPHENQASSSSVQRALSAPGEWSIPSADDDYLHIRNAVLRWGVTILPANHGTAARPPVSVENLLGPSYLSRSIPAPGPSHWEKVLRFGEQL